MSELANEIDEEKTWKGSRENLAAEMLHLTHHWVQVAMRRAILRKRVSSRKKWLSLTMADDLLSDQES